MIYLHQSGYAVTSLGAGYFGATIQIVRIARRDPDGASSGPSTVYLTAKGVFFELRDWVRARMRLQSGRQKLQIIASKAHLGEIAGC